MALSVKKNMSEEMVFAQELSDDELETVSGGLCGLNGTCSGNDSCEATMQWRLDHCTKNYDRHIYEGGFPNCAATVEDGSYCSSNDACYMQEVVYKDMVNCSKAWE